MTARLSVLAALLLSGCTRVIVVRECQAPEPPRVTQNVAPNYGRRSYTTAECTPTLCPNVHIEHLDGGTYLPVGSIEISTAALRGLSTGYHINGVSW